MRQTAWAGHGAALLTILIWGTTFISTKVLLTSFQPVEILFLRFVLGFLALCLIYPRRLRLGERRQELWFAAAGLCGVTLYYLLENIALTYTMASNVGVIISVSPCFTALLTHFLMRGEERLLFHPCVNTATLAVSGADFFGRLLPALGHEAVYVDMEGEDAE